MVSTSNIVVREARFEDIPDLLALMMGLADFEGYIDEFKVTQKDLIENGFGEKALFKAFVGHQKNTENLTAMAVTYMIPWTYDLRPTLVLKELFVSKPGRGHGLGTALMEQVKRHAMSIGAQRIQWTVLSGNNNAEKFYKTIGAEQDRIWLPWKLNL